MLSANFGLDCPQPLHALDCGGRQFGFPVGVEIKELATDMCPAASQHDRAVFFLLRFLQMLVGTIAVDLKDTA